MAAADMLVCPSRHEPLGNVVIEAWAQGLPVIATAADGPRALIHDGETGLIVPVDDQDALAGAMNRLIQDPALAEMLRTNGTAATYRLSGAGVPGVEICEPKDRTDLFANVHPRVDVLVVIDDHASMDAFREKLVTQMRALPGWLDDNAIDWRLGVTTSGVGGGCLGGQLLGDKVSQTEARAAASTLAAFGPPAVAPLVTALADADDVRTPAIEGAAGHRFERCGGRLRSTAEHARAWLPHCRVPTPQ